MKKGFSILLTIFSLFLFHDSYSQDLLPADSIPKAVKEKLKSLYPKVNPESKEVWWSPYGLLPKGYWANFLVDLGNIEIHFTEKGDTVNTIYLSRGFQYIKTPGQLKKIIDSIFPDAERIECQANGTEGWGHIGDSANKVQAHDSNDENISIYLALARYKFDADQHNVRVDFEDNIPTEIVIDNPDTSLLPLSIRTYVKKHYRDYLIEVMIKYYEDSQTKYQITMGMEPQCGKHYILQFNSLGKCKKKESLHMRCGDFL
jgi:hypothetical protein